MVCLISPAPLVPNYKQNSVDPIAACSDDPIALYHFFYPDGQHRCSTRSTCSDNELKSIDSDDGSESVQEQKQSVDVPSPSGLLTPTDTGREHKKDGDEADREAHRERQRSKCKKAPAASGPIAARPHFPVLSNSEVARQEKVFLEDLRNKAFIKVMAGDGACFFRSICDQLHQDGGEGHAALRADTCDFIEANKQQYSDFFS